MQITCYPAQLNQVFMNILVNACQAIDEALEVDGEGRVNITAVKKEEGIEVSIADNGPGISEELQDKIFEPFFTTKDIGEGTGLGMSISYGIIEKHGGSIIIDSELGQGCKFIIYIPYRSDKTLDNHSPAPTNNSAQ